MAVPAIGCYRGAIGRYPCCDSAASPTPISAADKVESSEMGANQRSKNDSQKQEKAAVGDGGRRRRLTHSLIAAAAHSLSPPPSPPPRSNFTSLRAENVQDEILR